MKLILYNILFPFAFILYLPFFLRKLRQRDGFRKEIGERFGLFSKQKSQHLRELKGPVWIHAVSVGEVVAAIGFMQHWRRQEPGLEFVLSTTTTTGYDTARQKLPENTVLIFSPLDFFIPVIKTLRLVKPSKLIIFEVELWPNLISLASLFKVSVALVNGRLSDRSALGYARNRWFFRPIFKRFNCICVQSEDDAERIKRVTGLNAPVYVCNTMKFDQTTDTNVTDLSELLDRVFADVEPEKRLVWTAGSTHPGEEDTLLRVFNNLQPRFPGLKMILAPRHCERVNEVEETLREHQVTWLRRSRAGQENHNSADVLLVDTTGELMNFYAAADLVFVGKSLAGNSGGHNIIEPALFGKPIIHGSRMENFRLAVSLFKREKACLEVSSETELRNAVYDLLNDPSYRDKLGKRSQAVVEKYRGAMDKTLKIISQNSHTFKARQRKG